MIKNKILLLSLSTLLVCKYVIASTEIDCYRESVMQLQFEKSEAIQLCAGSTSSIPVFCVKTVMTNNFEKISRKNAIVLCQFAESPSPPICFRDAIMIHQLTEAQAVELCRARINP